MFILYRFAMLIVSAFYNLFFFFKQKTAYEMRISDWSSDVCSSDLLRGWSALLLSHPILSATSGCMRVWYASKSGLNSSNANTLATPSISIVQLLKLCPFLMENLTRELTTEPSATRRSEEHTSELQSLMRNSYAVFCLKKNKTP